MTARLVLEMGWWGVAWRMSVLVGCFAAFCALPVFQSYRDTVVSLLTVSPRRWFNENDRSASLHSVVRTSSDAVFSQEALMMYDGSDHSKGIYLAILGSVYDVSSGRKHYGPDGSYGFFSGKDGSRAFVTGDFSDSGLTDDVSDLTNSQWLDLLHWFQFYDKQYVYIGKVAGRFYDWTGAASAALLAAQSSIDDALSAKQRDDARQRVFPPCNSRWSDAEGSTVWCSTKSGGIERSWDGVPRKYFDTETQQTRCVCVRTTGAPSDPSLPDTGVGDLEHPSLKEYEQCSPSSNICRLH